MTGKKETQAEWPSLEAGQKRHRDKTEREGPVKKEYEAKSKTEPE